MEVRELYFNTPARRKFLKSEQTELGHCLEMIRRVALARPDVAISVLHNGKAVEHWNASDPPQARVAKILGEVVRYGAPAARRARRTARRVRLRGPADSEPRPRRPAVFLRERPLRARQAAHARRARRVRGRAARQPLSVVCAVSRLAARSCRRERASVEDRSAFPRFALDSPVRVSCRAARAGAECGRVAGNDGGRACGAAAADGGGPASFSATPLAGSGRRAAMARHSATARQTRQRRAKTARPGCANRA